MFTDALGQIAYVMHALTIFGRVSHRRRQKVFPDDIKPVEKISKGKDGVILTDAWCVVEQECDVVDGGEMFSVTCNHK